MKESLDQTLDNLLTQSISFKKVDDEEGFSLTVLSSIEGKYNFLKIYLFHI